MENNKEKHTRMIKLKDFKQVFEEFKTNCQKDNTTMTDELRRYIRRYNSERRNKY